MTHRFVSFASFFSKLALVCGLQVLAQAPRDRQAVIEVPFEFIHGSIVVQANLNGVGPFSMMLDTGADPSVVELGTAKRVGLKIAGSGQKGSGGGTAANLAYETPLAMVQLGGLTATHVDAASMDLSKVSSALGRPIGGVLGYSLLRTRIVQIDYPHRKVRFLSIAPVCGKGALMHPPACTTLSFRYNDDIAATGVKVDGMPVTANLDTGSNSSFQLTPAAVTKLGLGDDLAKARASSSVGFNGDLKNRSGTLRVVTVGAISVNDPAVVFFGKGMGMDQEPWDLRMGNEFLKNFVVTVDYRHGQIILSVP